MGNRRSKEYGSSRSDTAVSALAALLPQKHLGTVLRPIDGQICGCLDQFILGSNPVWLAIRTIHFLQNV